MNDQSVALSRNAGGRDCKYVSAAVNKDLVQVPGRSSVVIAKHVVFVCHLVGHAHFCFVEIVA